MTIGGTLPRRKPGTLICWAMVLYAASRLGLSSSKGTSTVSLARVGLKVSTVLFTGGSPQSSQSWAVVDGRGWSWILRSGIAPPRERRDGRGDRTRTCDLLLPKQAR